MEEWRPVLGFEGLYLVSDQGRVRSLDRVTPTKTGQRRYRGKVLRPTLRADGRLVVNLSRNGRYKIRLVHQLVLEAFVGPCPEGMVCRHFPDPDPTNNRLENLSWGTQAENMADRVVHGTDSRGEDRPSARLGEADIPNIRAALSAGRTQDDIAAEYGVCQMTISAIARGKTWAHVTEGAGIVRPNTRSRGEDRPGAKLREADIPNIRAALAAGRSTRDIATEYGVHRSAIWMIKSGKRWSHVP